MVIATCSLISEHDNDEYRVSESLLNGPGFMNLQTGVFRVGNESDEYRVGGGLLNGAGFMNLQTGVFRVGRQGLNGPGMISSRTTPNM